MLLERENGEDDIMLGVEIEWEERMVGRKKREREKTVTLKTRKIRDGTGLRRKIDGLKASNVSN